MAKGWTKEERKKHIRERVHEQREKVIVLSVLLIIVVIFLAAIYYSFAYRVNPAIPIILIIALFVVVVVSTFFVDFIFYESQ
jgi:membrane protein YdbS with pleckstrin-like domain